MEFYMHVTRKPFYRIYLNLAWENITNFDLIAPILSNLLQLKK
jgi:hypothetical protein